MNPESPKTPLETFEAAAGYAKLGIIHRPLCPISTSKNINCECDYQQRVNDVEAFRQAALAYGEAEVRAKLEGLKHDTVSVKNTWTVGREHQNHFVLPVEYIDKALAALPKPDAGEVGK